MDNQSVFTYPLMTYLGIMALAAFAGGVRYFNTKGDFKVMYLVRDCVTSAFNGLVAFWVCDYKHISGSLMLVIVSVAAMMGARAWNELENYLRMRFGVVADRESQRVLSDTDDDSARDRDGRDDRDERDSSARRA